MKDKLLLESLKINKNILIPNYVIKFLDKLDLELKEFIIIIYLINQTDKVIFDINKLSSDLNLNNSEVLELISSLNEKNYISIEMNKINGIIEEYISLELFYNKIISFLIENNECEEDNSIFSVFEAEFGRTLSPTELDTISGWKENNISNEMIKEALKEAVLSGVHNMRYIDKILFEWSKKGYKNIEDIKKTNTKKEELEEIYDYDWLNE